MTFKIATAEAIEPRGSAGSRRRQQQRFAALMLAPTILLLCAFTIYPFIANVWYSVSANDLTRPDKNGFVGLQNFWDAITAPGFASVLGHTVTFVCAGVGLELLLGFTIATLLWQLPFGVRLFTAILTLPFALTPIATDLGWRLLLNPGGGPLNTLLHSLGLPQPQWTSSPSLALPSLILIDAWQWTPFVALIFMGGYMALPAAPFEAAAIDGAGYLSSLRWVAVPLLRPLALVVIIFRAVDSFRTFDLIWVITGGGPGIATETLNIRLYRTMFVNLKMGEAAALSLLMLLVLIGLGKAFAGALRAVEER